MVKIKVILDEEKIKNESNLSVEETYDKISKEVYSIKGMYIEGKYIYAPIMIEGPNKGCDDLGTMFRFVEELCRKPFIWKFLKELTWYHNDSIEDWLIPMEEMLKRKGFSE